MLTDIHSHHTDRQGEAKLISCSMPGISHDEWDAPHISLSLHPWYVSEENLEPQLGWIEKNLYDTRVLAIGEVGLDKVCSTPLALQLRAFRSVAAIAETYQLPLIIHCVRAYNEIVSIKRELKPAQPWIIHGFRGKKELMEMLVHHGFYLSFGEKYQLPSVVNVPVDRMLVETDDSHVGIDELYARLAKDRGTDSASLIRDVQNNIRHLFPALTSVSPESPGE